METCIIVPSHINNINRTKLLIYCLKSLINQTKKIPIYLSISFETDLDKTLFNKLIEKKNTYMCYLLASFIFNNKYYEFKTLKTIKQINNKIKN